jgi:phosphate-selective porin OprO/OprP
MTLKNHIIYGALAGSLLFAAHPSAAQTSSITSQMQALQQQIQQMQQQLQALQRQVDVSQSQAKKAQEDAAQAQAQAQAQARAQAQAQPAAAPTGVKSTLSPNNRPGVCSADGENCIELTSRVHFDLANYLSVHPQQSTGPHSLTDGVNARRARIGVLGKFFNDWSYALIYDFGGSTDVTPTTTGIENAYITYNGLRPVAFDLGYLDVPFTLDESTSSNDIMFIERAEVQNVVSNLAGNDARAAFGVRSNDDRYWTGVYLTGPTAGSTHTGSNSQQIGGTARFSYQVLQGSNYSLHLGADGEYVFQPRAATGGPPIPNTVAFTDRPELRVDPTAFLNTGAIPAKNAGAYGVEAAAGYDSFFFQGEYYRLFVDQSGLSPTAPKPELTFDGGYAEASWTLTGESRRYIPAAGAYSGIVPAHPFSLRTGGWGALEVALRYSYLNLNDHNQPGVAPTVTGGIFGGRATGYAVGLNWYPINNVRFMLNYIHDDVNKRPVAAGPGGTTSGGVRMDAVALRSQVAF